MRALEQRRRGGGGRGGGPRGAPAPQQQAQQSEAALDLLDPVRLLSRAAFGSSLGGVARAANGTLYAWAVKEQLWTSLADAMARASEGAGELAYLREWTLSDLAPEGGYDLLESTDGGATWTPLPPAVDPSPPSAPGLAMYPSLLAAAPEQVWLLLSGHDRRSHAYQRLLRYRP